MHHNDSTHITLDTVTEAKVAETVGFRQTGRCLSLTIYKWYYIWDDFLKAFVANIPDVLSTSVTRYSSTNVLTVVQILPAAPQVESSECEQHG